jgi:hypothetical protein
LATSVPFIRACPSNITISGLTTSLASTPYFNDTLTIQTIGNTIPTQNTSTIEYVGGSWNQNAGSWVMEVKADTLAGLDYVITFNLLQMSAPNAGVGSMSMASSGIQATSGLLTILPDLSSLNRPLRVNALTFDRQYISQSSPFPCDNNTLTVTLVLKDDSLFQSCKPNVTISGLTGSYTPNSNVLPIEWSQSSAATSGQWTQLSGRLVFSLPFQSN